MENGALVISLDFELLWGVFDKVDWREKQEYFQNTRKVIPEILELFEKHEISCTWATVGMLFNENWDEWNSNIPLNLPNYENKKLSAYKYGQSIQSKETEGLCFAPNLIKQIKDTPRQEISTHTYSHYYCLEEGQDFLTFKSDLNMAKSLGDKMNISLKSLVFPRNQFNANYLKVCKDQNIESLRTNPDNWYWKNTQKDSFLKKVYRTGDAYIGKFDKSYNTIELLEPGLKAQKASRFLRPHSGKMFLDYQRLKRIFDEMAYAAENNQIYHIWWHPHNFGGFPDQSLNELILILKEFERNKNIFGFQSLNMQHLMDNY